MNAYSSLILTLFFVVVLYNKNEKELITLLSKEQDFLKWGAALALVYLGAEQFGQAGDRFILIVYVAMLLLAVKENPKVFDNLTEFLVIK
jgi:hypothetical protein